MHSRHIHRATLLGLSAALASPIAHAQESSIYVQCPDSTDLHPTGDGITCKHLMAGDGMVTMADDEGRPLYVFGFAEVPEGGPAETDPAYPGWVMEQGMMAANAPAPTIAIDEDDEFFLTLTNVGMMMRPDLFDPHSVHWHGFANAAAIFDGSPDSSISVNMGASLTYYYYAVDAGTYMYHCHVEATEHMQMGMVGNLYVRPRQNRLPDGTDLAGFTHQAGFTYAYNDGDGSTYYDVDYPVQIVSFDSNFHEQHLNVQPLPFGGMRDNYFLLNGRGYPDTVDTAALSTMDPMGMMHESQPISSLIEAWVGDKILLRISNLNVTQFSTLATNGLPMLVVGRDARLLRDEDGNNMYYQTNSLTLGGGQSADVILDTTGLTPGSKYFLYTTNLHHLANDGENFGGMMTEIRVY
jgi:FtsP/CotA-like multicopper oxidase with cupredoxin domain